LYNELEIDVYNGFPILGGRLLKSGEIRLAKPVAKFPILGGRLLKWLLAAANKLFKGFQSLEGGY